MKWKIKKDKGRIRRRNKKDLKDKINEDLKRFGWRKEGGGIKKV